MESHAPPPAPWPSWLAPVGLGLAVFALYAACAARTVQGGDAGELMTVAAIGSVPHPPGYPLQAWLLRAVHASLPFGTSALRASLVSAAQVAVGVGLLADTGQRLTRSRAAGLLAAGVFAGSLTIFRYATVAEVFGSVVFTAAAVCWVAARVALGWRGPVAGLALGLAVASGVASHHTVVLLAPLAIWAAFALLPRPLGAAGVLRAWGAVALGLLAGFAAYLPYLWVQGGWSWGETEHLAGLLGHFLRKDYGTLSLSAAETEMAWYASNLHLGARLVTDSAGLLVAAALAGAVLGLRGRERRWFWAALLGAWLLAGPGFQLRANLGLDHLGAVLARRFHIMPAVLLVPFAALGLDALLQRVGRSRRVLLVGLGALVLALALRAVPRSSHRHELLLDRYLRAGLEGLPPGAMLVGGGDDFLFGTLYLQWVEGVRPDVLVIDEALLKRRWYRDFLAEHHPSDAGFVQAAPSTCPALALAGLERGPLFFTVPYWNDPASLAGLPGVAPQGGWLRAFPAGEAPPSPWQVAAALDGIVAAGGYESPQGPRLTAMLDSRETWVHDQLAFSYLIVADAMDRLGDAEGASRAEAIGLGLAPWLVAEQGPPGRKEALDPASPAPAGGQ